MAHPPVRFGGYEKVYKGEMLQLPVWGGGSDVRRFWMMATVVGALSWWLWFSTASVFLSSFFRVRAWSAPFWIVAVVAFVPAFAAVVLPGVVALLDRPVGRETLGGAAILLFALAAASFVAGGMWLLPPAGLSVYARSRVGAPA